MNMGRIYKQFEKEQEELKRKYLAAGMTEVQVKEMYENDKYRLDRDIAYQRRTQPLFGDDGDFEEDSQNSLLKKFSDTLCIEMEPTQSTHLWWIDEIKNESLLRNLLRLSSDELELIDQLVFQELTQEEISELSGKSQSAISQKINTIRKKLKN